MPNQEPAKSFANIVASLSDGSVNSHISEELHKLTQELDEEASRTEQTQRGKLKLEFEVEVDRNGNAHVIYKVESRVPVKKNSGGHMWLTEGGNLSNEKPGQPELPMIAVASRQEMEEA